MFELDGMACEVVGWQMAGQGLLVNPFSVSAVSCFIGPTTTTAVLTRF
jgi:hypothetical protein